MRLWITVICCLFLLLAACGNQETSEPIEEPPEEEEITPPGNPDKEEVNYPYTAPLTGLGSMEEVDQRIIMAMIDNHPNARPQSGLDKADIVYEILEEGWITRFNAFFQSQEPEVIGPIRSIRPYNIELALGYDAAMVHAGGSPQALDTLRKNGYADLDEIYNAGACFWRENFRGMPHNLYTDLDKLREGAKAKNFRESSNVPLLKFKDKEVEMEGTAAEHVQVSYATQYQLSYEYDEETARYKRFTEGKPHMDLTTGEQYSTTNLLVIASQHRIIDQAGRRDIDLHGPGNGYLFQRGKALPVEWRKEDGIIRVFREGSEVGFYPGNTWVQVIPNVPALDQLVKFD